MRLEENSMRTRVAPFLWGFLSAVIVIIAGALLFIAAGGVSMETTAHPLPLERTIAKLALHASFGRAADQKSPLPLDDANLLAGARAYREICAVCHSTPGQPHTAIAKGMFPDPPALFDPHEMVTDDPEGITYWKVTHGIRLSGMPGFGATLSDTERWQVTMLVAHADKLSPAVRAALKE
jgi:mono/diheme cytochrome c family protein